MGLEIGSPTPKEALAYWKSKTPLPKNEYDRLSERAKDRAFAVAGLARRSQVSQLHTALTAALEKGETLHAFKQRVAKVMEAKGWSGEKRLAGGEHLPHKYAKRLHGRALYSDEGHSQNPALLALSGHQRPAHPAQPRRAQRQGVPG